MYRIDCFKKHDPYLRWGLQDRIFFACGNRHILAYALLQQHRDASLRVIRLKPASGFTGNHIQGSLDCLLETVILSEQSGDPYRSPALSRPKCSTESVGHTIRKILAHFMILLLALLTQAIGQPDHHPLTVQTA